jgi:hypothetical protein
MLNTHAVFSKIFLSLIIIVFFDEVLRCPNVDLSKKGGVLRSLTLLDHIVE